MSTKAKALRPPVIVTLLIAGGVPYPLDLSAQDRWQYGGNHTMASRYEYRGVARHNGFSVHNELFVAYGQKHWIALGAWATSEPGLERDRTTYLGAGRANFGEADVWVELSGRFDPLRVTAGGVRHVWNFGTDASWPQPQANPTSLENLPGTSELFARVEGVGLGRVVPHAMLTWDVDEIRGIYLEYGATVRIPMWTGVLFPAHSLNLSGVLGHNISQTVRATRPGYYARRGLTHLDLSLGTTLGPGGPAGPIGPIGPWTWFIYPEIHYQRGWDAVARTSSATATDGTRWWLRLGLGWTATPCRPDRRLCP